MTDPTRNERQRLYRARRKAEAHGLVEVRIGHDVFFVTPGAAEEARRIIGRVNWLTENDGFV